MKKLLFYIKWIAYFSMTNTERVAYQQGKLKGMHCSKIEVGIFSNQMTYHPKTKPYRNYLTFAEFKKLHYP